MKHTIIMTLSTGQQFKAELDAADADSVAVHAAAKAVADMASEFLALKKARSERE